MEAARGPFQNMFDTGLVGSEWTYATVLLECLAGVAVCAIGYTAWVVINTFAATCRWVLRAACWYARKQWRRSKYFKVRCANGACVNSEYPANLQARRYYRMSCALNAGFLYCDRCQEEIKQIPLVTGDTIEMPAVDGCNAPVCGGFEPSTTESGSAYVHHHPVPSAPPLPLPVQLPRSFGPPSHAIPRPVTDARRRPAYDFLGHYS